MSFTGQSETTTETTQSEYVDPKTTFIRKFAYVPFRLEGKFMVFGFYYENLSGEKISQRTFLMKRLGGKASLKQIQNPKKPYFPRISRKI